MAIWIKGERIKVDVDSPAGSNYVAHADTVVVTVPRGIVMIGVREIETYLSMYDAPVLFASACTCCYHFLTVLPGEVGRVRCPVCGKYQDISTPCSPLVELKAVPLGDHGVICTFEEG